MFRNYLLTIFRQIKKNKLFSMINIIGLALGMAACLVIAQYVSFHSSFDQHHADSDKIFRLQSNAFRDGEELGVSIESPAPLSGVLASQSPEITSIARFYPYNYANATLTYNRPDTQINHEQTGIYGAEHTALDLFNFEFVAGGATAFDEPNKAIMSLKNASLLFENPLSAIGEKFTLNTNSHSTEYELVGVVKDQPENSHIKFNLLISYVSIDAFTEARTKWPYNSMLTYIKLKEASHRNKVAELANHIFKEEASEIFAQSGYSFEYYLHPLKEIHLTETNSNDFSTSVDKQVVYALLLIAIIILVIAWINYMNLSLARTLERIKEMGIRMCMGSSKRQLTTLFLLEALVMNILAFLTAIGITQLLQDYLLELTGLSINVLNDPKPIIFMMALILLGTLLIGLYPSILLKTLRAVNVITGITFKNSKGISLRKGLVFAQFMITCFLIASTLTVYNQIKYMKNADLKIAIENILVIKSPPTNINDEDQENSTLLGTLKNKLIPYPAIKEITSSGMIPGEWISWGTQLRLKNSNNEGAVSTRLISMDYNYPTFFEIDLMAGRNLRKGDSPWSKSDVVINEKLAKQLGFENPEDAIGAKIDGFYAPLEVRGVLENHHHTSLHADFEPIAYIISGWSQYFFVKLELNPEDQNKAKSLASSIDTIEKEWDTLFPNYPFDYFFLDTYFNQQYLEDERFGKLFTGFSSLAIVIACLGLFGLTSFTIQQRTKEIGIRKVLGANLSQLMFLLSSEYIMLVLAACLITLPLAWWAMYHWLLDYTFRITIGWWFFIVPILLVLFLAVSSIVSRVINTAQKNPVQSLRYE